MLIKPKSLNSYPWYLRPFYWNQKRKYGAVLDAALIWGHSPRLFLGVAFLYGMIDRKSSPLSPALRSLVTVRISQINACSFCVDLNSATLLKRGVSMEKVSALANWRASDLFTEHERQALEYAEAVTQTGATVRDHLLEAIKGWLGENGVVELTGLIAFQNLSSKFNSALSIPAQGFCPLADPSSSEKPASSDGAPT